MRVSSAIVLAVVAALASSISAKPNAAPDTAGADICPNCMTVPFFLHSKSCFRFHIGAVWPLALTHELLVISNIDQKIPLFDRLIPDD